MADECVSGKLDQAFNLFSLCGIFKIKFTLIWFASWVKLSYVLFEWFNKELLGFLAHDINFGGNSFVHLFLSLGSVFSFDLFGDLTNLGFSSILVMWLIYFLVHILSRISKLVLDVGFSLLTLSELDEKVSKAWVGEEPLFGFLGVLVHGISYHLEVNRSSLNHFLDIFFLEVMAQNDG